MFYDMFEVTTRQYEADRAKALRQHQRIVAAQAAQQGQRAPSPLRTWWTRFSSWVTSLRTRHVQRAHRTEDTPVS